MIMQEVVMSKYKVPEQIIRVVKKALEQNLDRPISQRAAYKIENNKRVPGTGIRTARRLISGSVDVEQLRLMRAWFARHQASPKEKKARESINTKASIAYRLWGGDIGRRWVISTLNKIEK